MHMILKYFRKNYVLAICEDAIHYKLFTLNLSHYGLEEIPDKVEQCILLRLFLNNNHLTKLDSSVMKLEQLQVLTLDYNKLDRFPIEICSLLHLRQLNISNNTIENLPSEIGHLTMLETFWCNNTGLKSIPEEIANCVRLETFGARGNKLKNLPESFGSLSNLRWLTLESNELSNLSGSFANLENLKHLNLKNNLLTRFPRFFRNMKQLKFVFLNCNRIKKIPSSKVLEDCRFMRMLNLSNNPFEDDINTHLNLKQHHYVVYEQSPAEKCLYEIDDDDEEGDDDFSDWENSIATSDIDSTDESEPEFELEDISVLIPELARYVTNFC